MAEIAMCQGVHRRYLTGGDYSVARLQTVVGLVAVETGRSSAEILSATRGTSKSSEARFIAYYLMNTALGHSVSEIGALMRRDRTAVRSGVSIVEERRDDLCFDMMMCRLEEKLRTMGLPAVKAVGVGRSTTRRLVELA
ncbi:helix-turn-helix domain-containing protein [Acuticoccus sediminis]|uniref:helix-turn-helix domain-containing protein n=1 Tax=Acuticoccus sediminis TaxID=2184697 RepID=UPI001CFDC2C8|nr:helix-turn-helix domain-containing protein [Acuticoccus sediminis]